MTTKASIKTKTANAAAPRRRSRTSARKRPTQTRAMETVEALLEATRRCLIRDGYDQLSTNKIADAAGCSIGSLYQYFPSKEALVAELVDRHTIRMVTVCRDALARSEHMGLVEAVQLICTAMVEAHALNPKLSRIFREQLPRVGKLKLLNDMHQGTAAIVEGMLRARSDVRVADPALTAFFVVRGVDALIHASLDLKSKGLGEAQLVAELTRFVVGYLAAQDGPLSDPPVSS